MDGKDADGDGGNERERGGAGRVRGGCCCRVEVGDVAGLSGVVV